MPLETKAASDTHLHQHESASLVVPLQLIPSITSDHIRKYRSGNNIPTREKFHKYSPDSSIRSINENHQKFPDNNFIQTHFPVTTIQSDPTRLSKTSLSFRSPTVPRQAGTFLHRLINKFLSMTNTSRTRTRRKAKNTIFPNDSHTFVNITPKRRRRQRLNTTIKRNQAIQHCHVCRTYRNRLSSLPRDSLECSSQSAMVLNTNAITTRKTSSILAHKPSISSPKIQFEKLRPLNQSQCQLIASAVQLIFDTLISNYDQI